MLNEFVFNHDLSVIILDFILIVFDIVKTTSLVGDTPGRGHTRVIPRDAVRFTVILSPFSESSPNQIIFRPCIRLIIIYSVYFIPLDLGL